MTAADHWDVAHERVGDAGGPREVGVQRPPDDLDLGPDVALAGVEAPVGRKVGVQDQSHQAGLAAGEEVAEGGVDRANEAGRRSHPEPARPLGEQDRTVGEHGQVPGNGESIGDHTDS